MTENGFHAMALRLGAVETQSILDTVRFRVAGRVFASLGWPSTGWAVVQLSLSDQTKARALGPAFMSEPGPRGERGVTLIRLQKAGEADVAEVLADAWREAFRRREIEPVPDVVSPRQLSGV